MFVFDVLDVRLEIAYQLAEKQKRFFFAHPFRGIGLFDDLDDLAHLRFGFAQKCHAQILFPIVGAAYFSPPIFELSYRKPPRCSTPRVNQEGLNWLYTTMKLPDQPLSFEQYGQAAEALHVLSGILLFEFVRREGQALSRNRIARNSIARADTTVRGIFRLWEISDQTDCWILHRALLDRLFHLHNLNQKDQFEVFNDWSFKMLYEAAGQLRSFS